MRKSKVNIFIYIIPLFILLNSCIFDTGGFTDEEYSLTYPVTFTIKTRTGNDVYASEEELMHKLDLYIVNNADNKIEKIINLEFTSLTEEHKADVKLTSGNKTIYSFANLQDAQKTEIGISGLTEGNTMPDMTNAGCTLPNGFSIVPLSNLYMPMSKKSVIRVTKMSGQNFSIEMVRMMCKVKLTFKNETGYKLAIKEFSLSPFTSSAIFALPQIIQGAPSFPVAISRQDYTRTLSPEPSLENNASVEYFTYLNETAVPDDGYFKLKIKTQKDGSIQQDIRMSLTNLKYLNRNDYMPLTVIISDYKLDMIVRSYPPIGGYASVTTTGTDEYYCNFSGGGPFVITPKLTKLSDNTDVSLSSLDFSYTDASTSIFSTPPTLSYKYEKPSDPTFKSAEITGILNTTGSDKALLNISLNITSGTGITRTIACKVYIVLN